MEFREKLNQYQQRIKTLSETMQDITEEATKNAFIMPLISLLGYDVFNPMEVIPEYTCDIGTKKGEKVDYAIIHDGEPIMLIEAKKLGLKLQKAQQNQLYRYFTTTRCRLAILTNGVDYKIYSDLNAPNVMDDEPFLAFNIIEDDEELYISSLEKLQKNNFNIKDITESAIYLKYAKVVEKTFLSDLQSPSDELVKYFLSRPEIKPNSKITSKMIDKHREITAETLQRLMGAIIQTSTTKEIVTEQTTIIPINALENQYGYLVDNLKNILGQDISAEYVDVFSVVNINIYRNNSKLLRIRVANKKTIRYDVTFFNTNGSYKKMYLCSNESSINNVINSELCTI